MEQASASGETLKVAVKDKSIVGVADIGTEPAQGTNSPSHLGDAGRDSGVAITRENIRERTVQHCRYLGRTKVCVCARMRREEWGGG